MAATTAMTPPRTQPKLQLAPGIPALPNPDATAFVCDALPVVVETATLVEAVPLKLLPTLVTDTDPTAELVGAFMVAAAVVCGATSSKIEEVMF